MTRFCAPFVLGAVIACSSCGLQPVELLPAETSVGADEFVQGDVPGWALARLRSERDELGKETLKLTYPQPPELVVPADLAAIGFEWRVEGKGKAAMPAEMAMGMPMMPGMGMPMGPGAASPPGAAGAAGKEAPPPADAMADKAKAEKEKADKEAKDVKELPVAYELRAYSDLADVRLYAATLNGAFPQERWRALLRAHTGATLSLALRAVYPNGDIGHAETFSLRVRADLPSGLFYNFSATAKGLTVGQLKDTHERALPVPAPPEQPEAERCSGCHAISRDGKRALVASATRPELLIWSLENKDAPGLRLAWPADSGPPLSYIQASFDPTAVRVAATRAGQLSIFNADTGAAWDASAMPLRAALANPDWSPDGRFIVVETGPSEMVAAEGGGLARIAVGVVDGSLSELMPLIETTGDEHLRAPVYSPDSEWIAYERRMGPAGDSKDAKLFLVRARGGEPIELRALAQGVRPMDGVHAPEFAPAGEPGRAYLLFSARRAVGSFTPEEGQRQLFAAELDLSLAAAGKDPSRAAFWLPFQQRSNNYLRTRWAKAFVPCTASVEVCGDGVDGNCNGEVDEECCTPASESCDGSDNDCDLRVDEGCECAFQEACEDGTDNDCDLHVDEKPCMPAPPMR